MMKMVSLGDFNLCNYHKQAVPKWLLHSQWFIQRFGTCLVPNLCLTQWFLKCSVTFRVLAPTFQWFPEACHAMKGLTVCQLHFGASWWQHCSRFDYWCWGGEHRIPEKMSHSLDSAKYSTKHVLCTSANTLSDILIKWGRHTSTGIPIAGIRPTRDHPVSLLTNIN